MNNPQSGENKYFHVQTEDIIYPRSFLKQLQQWQKHSYCPQSELWKRGMKQNENAVTNYTNTMEKQEFKMKHIYYFVLYMYNIHL